MNLKSTIFLDFKFEKKKKTGDNSFNIYRKILKGFLIENVTLTQSLRLSNRVKYIYGYNSNNYCGTFYAAWYTW